MGDKLSEAGAKNIILIESLHFHSSKADTQTVLDTTKD